MSIKGCISSDAKIISSSQAEKIFNLKRLKRISKQCRESKRRGWCQSPIPNSDTARSPSLNRQPIHSIKFANTYLPYCQNSSFPSGSILFLQRQALNTTARRFSSKLLNFFLKFLKIFYSYALFVLVFICYRDPCCKRDGNRSGHS